MANPLAEQLFAVGQMVGKNGANFKYTGPGGSYSGHAPLSYGGATKSGVSPDAMRGAGLLGSAIGGSSGSTQPPMANGALVSGDISNPTYSDNYSLAGAAQADNTQYGLMGQPQTGLGAGMQYQQAAPSASPYALNTQGLNYQQPSSGWGGFFD